MIPGADPDPLIPDFQNGKRLTLAMQGAQNLPVRIRNGIYPLMGGIGDIHDSRRRRHLLPDFRVRILPPGHDIPCNLQRKHFPFSLPHLHGKFLIIGRMHLAENANPVSARIHIFLCRQSPPGKLIHPPSLDLPAGLHDLLIRGCIIKLRNQLIRIQSLEFQKPVAGLLRVDRRIAWQREKNGLLGGDDPDYCGSGKNFPRFSLKGTADRVIFLRHALLIPSEPVPHDLASPFGHFLFQDAVQCIVFVPDFQRDLAAFRYRNGQRIALISGDSAGRRCNMEARVRIRRAEQMNENEKKKSRDKDLKSGEPPKSGLLHEACPPVPVKIRHSLQE